MNYTPNHNGLPFISTLEADESMAWQMSRSEKYAMIGLLDKMNPHCSIEIGTFQGGSLQAISKYSNKVYSIDISPEPKRVLKDNFDNVEFIVGQSSEVLGDLFRKIETSGEQLNFILVDGDHSRQGVYNDLKAILEYPHKNELVILLHDSYNPQCRKGMKSIDYSKHKNVAYIELDYVTGSFWQNGAKRQMWGGLGLIKVGTGEYDNVQINESARKSFEVARLHSIHIFKDKLGFLSPIKKWLYKRYNIKHRDDLYFDFEKD